MYIFKRSRTTSTNSPMTVKRERRAVVLVRPSAISGEKEKREGRGRMRIRLQNEGKRNNKSRVFPLNVRLKRIETVQRSRKSASNRTRSHFFFFFFSPSGPRIKTSGDRCQPFATDHSPPLGRTGTSTIYRLSHRVATLSLLLKSWCATNRHSRISIQKLGDGKKKFIVFG